MRLLPAIILLLSVTACSSDRATTNSAAEVDRELATAPGDTLVVIDDPACEFHAELLHPNPDLVLGEYLRKSASGQLYDDPSWLAQASTCPAQEVPSEEMRVVTGYIPEDAVREPHRITYTVTLMARGVLTAEGMRGRAVPANNEIVVVETPYGWRFESPAPEIFIMSSQARERGLID